MLILVLILCLATSLYVALRRKDSLSLYLLGMSVCNLRFQSLWTGWAMWWQ